MESEKVRDFVNSAWSQSVLPALERYIEIPNQSPAFDPQWRERGYMDEAVELVVQWMHEQRVRGLEVRVLRAENRTPLILAEVAGQSDRTALLYGHIDKQPPMDGWREGLGPWRPVIEGGKLYGRGGADDGYAAFAAITAIKALQEQGVPAPRCAVLIEACEESGSADLPYYVDALADRIGRPSLVVCLDSGCGNYEQLWVTTSLRGLVSGELKVQVLAEGVHSGPASGVVPSSFRVLRQLLSRLEDEDTGEILPPELHVEIPEERVQQARAAAAALGNAVFEDYPFAGGTQPVSYDVAELLLNRTWRPQMEVIGAAGLPPPQSAGNVLRPWTSVLLSLRLPPTADAAAAARALKQLFEERPPYGARVTFTSGPGASGWNAPPMAAWLADSVHRASLEFFGKEVCYIGEGGSIPFLAMLAAKFPQAQFLVTGVLGPHANAHGPNEFLHLDCAAKLTCCVARVLADHFRA